MKLPASDCAVAIPNRSCSHFGSLDCAGTLDQYSLQYYMFKQIICRSFPTKESQNPTQQYSGGKGCSAPVHLHLKTWLQSPSSRSPCQTSVCSSKHSRAPEQFGPSRCCAPSITVRVNKCSVGLRLVSRTFCKKNMLFGQNSMIFLQEKPNFGDSES